MEINTDVRFDRGISALERFIHECEPTGVPGETFRAFLKVAIEEVHAEAIASVKREPLDLMPVINWLENGCDPIEAAKELRIYQSRMQNGK